MLIKKIELSGFRSYKDFLSKELNTGISGIIGNYDAKETRNNGSGKSSFLMSIIYALYGEGEFDKVEELINRKSKDMFARVFFELKGNSYMAERGKKGSSSYLDFFENEVRLGDKISSTQEHINRILGMNYAMFTASVFFEQGNMDKFINVPADQRRIYIETVLGIEIWRLLYKDTKKDITSTQNEYKTTKANIEKLETCIAELKAKVSDYNLHVNTQNILSREREELSELLLKYANADNLRRTKLLAEDALSQVLSGLKSYQTTIDSSVTTIGTLESSFTTSEESINKDKATILDVHKSISITEKDIISCTDRIFELSTERDLIQSEINNINFEIKKLEAELSDIRAGICPTCKQEVDPINTDTHNNFIKLKVMELTSSIKPLSSDLANKNDILNGLIKMKEIDVAKLVELNKELVQLEYSIKAEESKIPVIEGNISRLLQEKEVAEAKIVELNEREQLHRKSIADIDQELSLLTLDVDIDSIKDKLSKIDIKIEEITRAIGTLDKYKEDLVLKTSEYETLNIKVSDLEYYVKKLKISESCFINVPKKIFDESILYIEDIANEIIQKIIPDMQVKIYEDESKDRKPLIISFIKDNESCSYKSLSGGEKTIANIALRLGFSEVIAERSNTDINFLVLDEPFGSLDEENRELIKSVLTEVSKSFKQIFVISHTDDINYFPNIINIRKSVDGNSYII